MMHWILAGIFDVSWWSGVWALQDVFERLTRSGVLAKDRITVPAVVGTVFWVVGAPVAVTLFMVGR